MGKTALLTAWYCISILATRHSSTNTYENSHAQLSASAVRWGGGAVNRTSKVHITLESPTAFNSQSSAASTRLARLSSHRDLWIALRGGANNFGIVTRFDFRSFPQAPFWGGSIYYFADSFPGQIDALVAELLKEDAPEDTHLMISVRFAAMFRPRAMCQNQVYYTREVDWPPAVLEPFVGVEPQIEQMN
jgi:hypothetical protein